MGEGSDRALTGTHPPAGYTAGRTPTMSFQQDLHSTAQSIHLSIHAGNHNYAVLVGGANGDQGVLESIDGRSIHYSVDQPAVHGRLKNVWASGCSGCGRAMLQTVRVITIYLNTQVRHRQRRSAGVRAAAVRQRERRLSTS